MSSNSCQPWTLEDVKTLKRYAYTKSNSEIAEILGRTIWAIKSMKARYGLAAKAVNRRKKYRKIAKDIKGDVYMTVCFYDIDGTDVDTTGIDLRLPNSQVNEILSECKANGLYEYFRRNEYGGVNRDVVNEFIRRLEK